MNAGRTWKEPDQLFNNVSILEITNKTKVYNSILLHAFVTLVLQGSAGQEEVNGFCH